MTFRWLGGAEDAPALTVSGETLTYRQLADLVTAEPTNRTGPINASSTDLVTTLVRLLASLAAQRPVIVADPHAPLPTIGDLPAHTFLIAVTSGSTGNPRAIARTAASWELSFAPLAELTGLRPQDTIALTGPLHATLHLFAAVHTLWLGAHLIDDPADATAIHCVPAVLADLLDRGLTPNKVIVAGANMPAALMQRAADLGVAVTEYYGSAETSFVAATSLAGSGLKPFPGVEVSIRDDRLWARSPYLASAYLGAEPGPPLRDREGFVTVGDYAEQGADGTLIIRGRGTSAINVGGATVIAEEVETVLLEQTGVVAAAVIGADHPRFGAIVTAILEVTGDADPEEIKAAARRRLDRNARPRRWLATDQLPRTANGKIARVLVNESMAAGTLPVRPLA